MHNNGEQIYTEKFKTCRSTDNETFIPGAATHYKNFNRLMETVQLLINRLICNYSKTSLTRTSGDRPKRSVLTEVCVI